MDDSAIALLITKLQAAAKADGADAQLLNEAAATLAAKANEALASPSVRPSAWMNREQKYKQDLLEVRRQLAIYEEANTRMTSELEAASSGTLVQKLREDIKVLEAANAEHKAARAELSSKLSDLTARNQALVGSSANAAAVWRDICAGKRLSHLPGLDHSNAMRSTTSTNGQVDSPSLHSPIGDGTSGTPPSNATIIVEHLSVSGAKAKLAQQQQLNSMSSFGSHRFDRKVSEGVDRRTSNEVERRISVEVPPQATSAGPTSPAAPAASATADSGATAGTHTGATGDFLDLLGKPSVGAPTAAAPAEDDDNDESRLLDIDDLLGMGAPVAQQPAASSVPAVSQPSHDLFAGLEAPAVVAHVSTEELKGGFMDAACQGEVAAALEDASTQVEAGAGQALAATQCEGSAQPQVASFGLQVELPARGSDAGTQATPTGTDVSVQASVQPAEGIAAEVQATTPGADAATQADTPAADAATQMVVEQGTDAVTQVEAPEGVEAAVQATVDATDATTQVEAASEPVDAAVQAEPLEAPVVDESGSREAPVSTTADELLEAAMAEVQEEAAAAAAVAAQAELKQTVGELSTAREQHQQALQQVETLQSKVEELQSEIKDMEASLRAMNSEQAETALAQESEKLAGGEATAARVVELELALVAQVAEVQEARNAAVRTAKDLQRVQDELSQALDSLSLAEMQLEALKEREGKMQLEIQAYEHTMAGLKLAVEEADADKNVQEQQAVEMATRLAYLTEFVSVKAKNPKHSTMTYEGWLKKQPKKDISAITLAVTPPAAPS